jgi:hypothetical protein
MHITQIKQAIARNGGKALMKLSTPADRGLNPSEC